MKLVITVGALALAMGMASGQARAVEVTTETGVTSINNCQPFLPAGAATTRSRPLGIKNDSTSAPSTVVCAWSWQYSQSVTGTDYVQAYFTNAAATASTVNCTFVIGTEGNAPIYVAKSVSVPANGASQANVFVQGSDIPDGFIGDLVSMSCNLPPLVTLNDTYLGDTADYDKGAVQASVAAAKPNATK